MPTTGHGIICKISQCRTASVDSFFPFEGQPNCFEEILRPCSLLFGHPANRSVDSGHLEISAKFRFEATARKPHQPSKGRSRRFFKPTRPQKIPQAGKLSKRDPEKSRRRQGEPRWNLSWYLKDFWEICEKKDINGQLHYPYTPNKDNLLVWNSSCHSSFMI